MPAWNQPGTRILRTGTFSITLRTSDLWRTRVQKPCEKNLHSVHHYRDDKEVVNRCMSMQIKLLRTKAARQNLSSILSFFRTCPGVLRWLRGPETRNMRRESALRGLKPAFFGREYGHFGVLKPAKIRRTLIGVSQVLLEAKDQIQYTHRRPAPLSNI